MYNGYDNDWPAIYNGYIKGLASQLRLATGKAVLGWPMVNMSFLTVWPAHTSAVKFQPG